MSILSFTVETLFRRGEKRLHDFAAHLFKKLCTKFHQNRRSFVGDITKKHFCLFFRTHRISQGGNITGM